MSTRTKILMAGALIAAASTLSAQAADQGDTSPTPVYGERATEDQRINNEVVNTIANDPSLSGQIGVETEHGDVTLTGRVVTPGQVDRAGFDARSVDGVGDVQNLVTPRVGDDF
jgi:osmotically-inducible protein OsmY